MAGLLPCLLAATLGLTVAQYSSCPEAYGLQLYPHEQYYDKFFKCGAGVAYETPCYKGLSYNPEIHVCDYPDQVPYCEKQSEGVVGFKYPAPHKLSPNAVARRLLPYPKVQMPGDETAYIVWVADNPRIPYCGNNSVFDPQTLSCLYLESQSRRKDHLKSVEHNLFNYCGEKDWIEDKKNSSKRSRDLPLK